MTFVRGAGAEVQADRRSWLRRNRARAALTIGIVETIVVLPTSWFAAVALGAAALALYLYVRRRGTTGTARDLAWTFAASQVLPVLVPPLVYAVGILAILAVVGVVVAVAAILYLDRR